MAIDPPATSRRRLSVDAPPSYSPNNGGGSSFADLEQQHHVSKMVMAASEMRRKRLSFTRPSSRDCVDSLPPLSQNMTQEVYLPSGEVDMSPPPGVTSIRRRYRALVAILATFASSLIGGVVFQVHLPTTTDGGVYSRKLKGKSKRAGYDGMMQWLKAETVGLPAKERKRMLAVGKSTWPRCISQRMTALQCKEMIDQDILNLNTDTDRFVRTIIIGKRDKTDPLSNSIVLPMDDNDRVLGRDGDGMIYYDFKWSGSGNEATRYEQRKIPPIIATEVDDAPTIDSVEIEIVPIRRLGASTQDAIYGYSDDPIAGGVQTLGTETDTPEGTIKLQAALAETATIELSGERSLGPFDCSGMTGHSCCLMIKHKVRDSNTNGQAIQCYLDYHEQTEKHKAFLNARGKKVFIFENHRGRISKEPKIVGDWPQGIASSNPDFHDWIQDGGGLSNGQMRLIHGPDWNPPGLEP